MKVRKDWSRGNPTIFVTVGKLLWSFKESMGNPTQRLTLFLVSGLGQTEEKGVKHQDWGWGRWGVSCFSSMIVVPIFQTNLVLQRGKGQARTNLSIHIYIYILHRCCATPGCINLADQFSLKWNTPPH